MPRLYAEDLARQALLRLGSTLHGVLLLAGEISAR